MKRNHQLLSLIIAGCTIEFLYLRYFLSNFPLWSFTSVSGDIGSLTQYSSMAMWIFIGMITFLFLVFSYCAFSLSKALSSRFALWVILGFGALFALTLSFVYPLTSQEIYTIISQSRLLVVYHANPLITSPDAFLQDHIMQLAGHFMRYPSSFGPLGVMIDAVPMLLLPKTLFANMLGLKLFFSAFLIGCAYLSYRIMRLHAPQYALSSALFIAWNPYLLFETSVNGHNDSAMFFLALLALLLFFKGHKIMSTSLVLVSALVKFATLLLFPLLLVYTFRQLATHRQRASYFFATLALGIGTATLTYLPFWDGPVTFVGCLFWLQFHLQSFMSVLLMIFPHIFTFSTAQLTSWIVFLIPYVYVVFVARKSKAYLLRASFMALFFFLLIGVSYFHSWYGIWAVMLASLVARNRERIIAVILAYSLLFSTVLFSYLWMWFDAKNPGTFAWFDLISYLTIFGPATAAMLVWWLRDRFLFQKSSSAPSN